MPGTDLSRVPDCTNVGTFARCRGQARILYRAGDAILMLSEGEVRSGTGNVCQRFQPALRCVRYLFMDQSVAEPLKEVRDARTQTKRQHQHRAWASASV